MLARYEPWDAMQQFHNEVNRAFGQAFNRTDEGSNAITSAWMPAVDVQEESDRFLISADVPGVDPKDVEITMEQGMLTIKGERKLETSEQGEKGYRRVERAYGSFYRRFSLPNTADTENISATGKNGVLEILIPKKVDVQPKRIQVAA